MQVIIKTIVMWITLFMWKHQAYFNILIALICFFVGNPICFLNSQRFTINQSFVFRIWAQLLDRVQERSSIIFIPIEQFDRVVAHSAFPPEPIKSNGSDVEMTQVDDSSASVQNSSNSCQSNIKVLFEDISDVWINVSKAAAGCC